MRRFGYARRYHDLIPNDGHLKGVLIQTACKLGISLNEMGYWAFVEETQSHTGAGPPLYRRWLAAFAIDVFNRHSPWARMAMTSFNRMRLSIENCKRTLEVESAGACAKTAEE